jgi:uncharacterized hydrophobic protein (TIGR00271 family)
MVLVLFKNLTENDKSVAVEHLIKSSTPSQDFFLMIILSVITATFGLLLNNVAVIIGSMLIAPMLYPFLSLSLGITLSDASLISRAFYTVLKAWAFGVIVSALTTLLFASHFSDITPEIFSRTQATLPFIIIAIVAGFAGSFALVKPQLNETLPGIAISVALIPPIAVTGIGIAHFSWPLVSGSILLFVVNAIGILFSGIITFSMMNFYVKRAIARKAVKQEDAKVEREIKKAENNNGS